jgi:HD superfamily phosphohydrolase YqeK
MPAFALHVDSCKKLFEHFKLRKESRNFALVAVGSVIPDLQEFGILKSVHGRAEAFLQYLLKTDPKYAPLAIGMIMHEELDRVIDTEFVNPNMPAARELLEQYEFSTEKVALAAHYLIDHTVNCSLIEKEPKILKITERIKKKLSHRHAHKIAYHLATFFNADTNEVLKAIHTFREFDLSQYLSFESSAALYGKFLFLQQELSAQQHTNLLGKVKLGLSYSKFLLGHRTQQAKNLLNHSKQKFASHGKAYLSARKAMIKRLAKLSTTYTLSLK